MTTIATLLADLLIRTVTGLIGLALGGWSSARPQSHGSSRWAGWRERNRLGRITRPEHAAGDGTARRLRDDRERAGKAVRPRLRRFF